jgi:hypothetical protein
MREAKTCVSCGRRFSWRKKWEGNWAEIRYCSAACRRRRVNRLDRQLEAAITAILKERGRGKSVCPSEIARAECGSKWRAHMECVRRAARRLAHAGEIEITQRDRVVDPTDAKGPIRLRLTQH